MVRNPNLVSGESWLFSRRANRGLAPGVYKNPWLFIPRLSQNKLIAKSKLRPWVPIFRFEVDVFATFSEGESGGFGGD
jgi:hypothetical protein